MCQPLFLVFQPTPVFYWRCFLSSIFIHKSLPCPLPQVISSPPTHTLTTFTFYFACLFDLVTQIYFISSTSLSLSCVYFGLYLFLIIRVLNFLLAQSADLPHKEKNGTWGDKKNSKYHLTLFRK